MGHKEFIHLAREDFLTFCALVSRPQFILGYHHELIALELEDILTGGNHRKMLNLPPRHGKSHLVSILFIAYYMGRFPDRGVIFATYGQDLADDVGYKVRGVINSAMFKEIFPNVTIATDSHSRKRFNIAGRLGTFFAIGRGGAITGRGGNLIVMDDLLKNDEEAASETLREKLIQWYKGTLYTRLMPHGSSIVSIGTRWHEGDIQGYLLEQARENPDDPDVDKWDAVIMKGIDDDNNPLWPEMFSIDDMLRFKKTLGDHKFSCLYQQDPIPDDGDVYQKEWFRYTDDIPTKFDFLIHSWDLTFKDTKNSDYVAGALWGVRNKTFYRLEEVHAKMSYVMTREAIIAFHERVQKQYGTIHAVLIEDKANGPAILSDLRQKIFGLIGIKANDSKISRARASTPLFQSGAVMLPKNAPWLEAYTGELIKFPNGKNDDRVDETSQALTYLKKLALGGDSLGVTSL